MSPNGRKFFIVVGTLALLTTAVVVSAGLAIQRSGWLLVQVQERGRGGTDISLRIPGVLVQAALPFVPDRLLGEARDHGCNWAPVLRAAAAELDAIPDCDLVLVETREESVRIAKEGGGLIVKVDSREDLVRVVLPLPLVGTVMKRIDRLG